MYIPLTETQLPTNNNHFTSFNGITTGACQKEDLIATLNYTFEKSFETVDSYDFSTLYNTLPHYLIKQKFLYLIEWCFDKTNHKYICCSRGTAFLIRFDFSLSCFN